MVKNNKPIESIPWMRLSRVVNRPVLVTWWLKVQQEHALRRYEKMLAQYHRSGNNTDEMADRVQSSLRQFISIKERLFGG